MSLVRWLACSFPLLLVLARTAPGQLDDIARVGEAGGKIVVPTNQVLSPAGKQIQFSGRPTDLALSPDGKWLGVLDRNHVALINPETGEIANRVSHGNGSYAGILFTTDSKTL